MVKKRAPFSICCKLCLLTWVRAPKLPDFGVIIRIETSYTLITSLIAVDVPRQIGWHLAGARRIGATVEEVRAVRKIAIVVATRAGEQWREEVPDVEHTDD
jgi:hypothetical protein